MLSVVTVLHNSAQYLPALLRSLTDGIELIAVDSGSDDRGADIAAAGGALVVDLGGNRGFGAACNEGVARASGDVTVLLNPDCEVVGDALEQLAARARSRTALHAPRLLEPDGSAQRSAHPLPGSAISLLAALTHPPLLPRGLRERAEPFRASQQREVGWVIAACVAARTETLRHLGPFDPAQFLFYEDMDLCLRARAEGIATVLHPEIAVRHAGGHATRPAYGGEPHVLLRARRAEVVEARLGRAARRRDDAAQMLTFAARTLARRPQARERLSAQLRRPR